MKSDERGISVLWIVVCICAVGLLALFVFNMNNRPQNPHLASGAWNNSMLEGSKDAPNKMVDYADYFCSYCSEIHEQTNKKEFKENYIDNGKLSYETRIITVLKDRSSNTEQGAEAAYCAADQSKFAEYSNDIIPRIRHDFFDKGIGVKNVMSPKQIEKLPVDYFMKSASNTGMDLGKFDVCLKQETHKSEIEEATRRAIQLGVTGLPYVVVNSYSASGFQGGWNGLQMILKAGGVQ